MKVIQKIAVWTLITVLFTQTFGVSTLYNLYTLDQLVFIEYFCVNTDKPEMHCNGSCMLSKLDEQDKKDSDKTTQVNTTQYHVYYYAKHYNIISTLEGLSDTKHHYYDEVFYKSQFQNEVFRPPILV